MDHGEDNDTNVRRKKGGSKSDDQHPIDFDAINRIVLCDFLNLFRHWLPGGRIEGDEYVPLNPTRNDRNPGSFRINLKTGKWADFAMGDAGGDPISLYAYLNKLNQVDAAQALADRLNMNANKMQKHHRGAPEKNFESVFPAPIPLEIPHHSRGKPGSVWRYKDRDGNLLGAICRFDKPGGAKDIVPLICCRDEKAENFSWVWRSFPKPRPLYGLHELELNPKAPVLVVEGEKTADAAQRLYSSYVVVTWPGGANAYKYADWSPLQGREVSLFPDNDEPGRDAVRGIGKLLDGIAAKIKFVTPPGTKKKGWDLADAEDWTTEIAEKYLTDNAGDELAGEVEEEAPAINYPDAEETPFTSLGYNHSIYYYHVTGTQQISKLSAANHTKANLLALAPLYYWSKKYQNDNGSINWTRATNDLLRFCESAGVYDPSRVRGRGAWFHDGDIALHLGDKVVLNNTAFKPNKVPGRYIYEAATPLCVEITNPLSTEQAYKFFELSEKISWDRPISARLYAGWCVCAHIAGALRWRSHLWITGPKASGKSTIMEQITKRIMGENCIYPLSDSTAAGIRQTLAYDSLPVLFDEIEGESPRDIERIKQILTLMRQSSSESSGQIIKGTQGGEAMNFRVRSSFIFSSINQSLMQPADKSRVTVLEINPSKRSTSKDEFLKSIDNLLTPEYVARFYARAIKLAAIIRKNAITFSRAVARELGQERIGDQIGTLLAGAYSLHSPKIIKIEDAVAWAKAQDWSETKDETHTQSDEQNLYNFLMQQKLKIRIHNGYSEFPIGKLIDVVCGLDPDQELITADCGKTLLMAGFKIEIQPNNPERSQTVVISNTSDTIKRLLKDTVWAVNWSATLKRASGAESTPAIWFGHLGATSRGVRIPIVRE